MKKIYFKLSFGLLLFICVSVVIILNMQSMVFAKDDFAVAKGMCVMNAETGKVLYGKNLDEQLPMASTTKLVTAIVALENMKDINEIVAVDDSAVGIEGTSIYLRKGEKLTLNELLTGLILASGNDAAVAIACHIGGSEVNFVKMMNDFAKKLNLENTHFDNPHGLDSKTHYTSAKDLATITSYALNNEDFVRLIGTKTAKISGNDEVEYRYLKNKNKLLFSQDGCLGGKTGFTDNALRCLVNVCKRDNTTIVSVVLNCAPMFEECDRLTEKAFKEFKLVEFVKPYNFIGTSEVVDGETNTINLATLKGFKDIVKCEEVDCYDVVYEIPDKITAPIKKGDKLGFVKVTYKGETIFEENILAITDVKNINLKYTIDNIISKWFK